MILNNIMNIIFYNILKKLNKKEGRKERRKKKDMILLFLIRNQGILVNVRISSL